MMFIARGRQAWNLHRSHTFHLARSVSSSVLDADVLAAAQQMVKDSDLAEAGKTQQLSTLKMQMPADDEHARVLLHLNRESKGLWFMYPCKSRWGSSQPLRTRRLRPETDESESFGQVGSLQSTDVSRVRLS